MKTRTVKPRHLGPKSKRVDVLFFGESPGAEEAKKGTAFIGPAGQVMQEIIDAEFPGRHVVLDNCVPEILKGGHGKPDNEKRHEWKEYRTAQIAKFKPKVVVLLGDHALRSFVNPKGKPWTVKPTYNCGRIEKVDGITFVMSCHPAYALRNAEKGFPLLEKTMKSVKSLLKRKRSGIERLDDKKSVQKFLRGCEKKLCAFDIETSTLDPKEGVILTVAVTVVGHPTKTASPRTVWIPLLHPEWFNDSCLPDIVAWWSKGPRIVHNLDFEVKWMRYLGGTDPAVLYDTMLLWWMTNENEPKSLNHLVVNVLGKKPYWLQIDPHKAHLDQVPLDEVGEYNGNDTLHTLELYQELWPKLTKKQQRLYFDLILPTAKTLVSMEDRGVQVSLKELLRLKKKNLALITRKTRDLHKDWPDLNVKSPKQVLELCEKKLKLKSPIVKRKWDPETKRRTETRSYNAEALAILAEKEPRLANLAEIRKKERFVGHVLDKWIGFVDENERLHSRLALATVTGRLSSSSPNLQNVDREGEQRKAMVSRFPNGVMLQADYAQHELRIYAAVAGDLLFLKAFGKGIDAHQQTCDQLNRAGIKTDRPTAKNVNFAVTYDITAGGLYEKYRIPKKYGAELIDGFHQTHPWLAQYHQDIEEELKEFGYVENMFGFRRHLGGRQTGRERRQAINSPIQGPACFITFLSMVEIEKYLSTMRSQLVLQIHDSNVIDCHPKEVGKIEKAVKKIMLGVDYWKFAKGKLKHDIPLGVDIKKGKHL